METKDLKQERIAGHFAEILKEVGCDLTAEDFQKTPERYARFLTEYLTRPEFDFTVFDAKGMSEMIIEDPIHWSSLCPHHTLPMFGRAWVAYIPGDKIAGLSKIPRTVEYISRGFATQEEITMSIGKFLMEKLNPIGVGVVLRGTHTCMTIRGAKSHGTETTTHCLLGAFRDDPSTRSEFLHVVRG